MNGKKKRPISLIVLTVIAFGVGVSGYLSHPDQAEPNNYYFRNSAGAVLFEHVLHTEMAQTCGECHHEMLVASDTTPCTDCHEEGMSAEDFDHTDLKSIEIHQCSYCHRENEQTSPQSCRNCHTQKQQSDKLTVSCIECHDESYTEDLLTHDEMMEIGEGHTCDGCHNARSISEVYHEQCNDCHIRENEDKFINAEGDATCQVCHLK